MASFDDVLAQAESADHVRTRSVRVLLRQDLSAQHDDLDERIRQLPSDESLAAGGARAREIAAELEANEAEQEASLVSFTFRAVGRMKWANMLAKHPPSKEQRQAHPRLDHNPETFPLVAMAASCVEPEGATLEMFKRLEASPLPSSVFDSLWACCLDANLGSAGASPKSAAAGLIRRLSGQSGTSASGTDGQSPEASSLAGS